MIIYWKLYIPDENCSEDTSKKTGSLFKETDEDMQQSASQESLNTESYIDKQLKESVSSFTYTSIANGSLNEKMVRYLHIRHIMKKNLIA